MKKDVKKTEERISYYYKVHCDNKNLEVEECPYKLKEYCPRSCSLYQPKILNGLQRFNKRFPNWNLESRSTR